ncbi:DNA replication/repair protein RecF [Aestuariicella sp. G3-2]|uniref:DNA replication/repair protein RecF n=1 Tax=Pseudomaricurvus albidus TaxID=2842452 RepID=UPI001C0DC33C|nr:DNA replication/repair protein RecF [Aestuariicella albida]MBU3068671.1 DNA replication/repair protein RecF [Aestuariicella albida]
MTLRRLSAHNFRNLKAVDIELSPQLNIFFGDNGSGKTSVLEAISTLSLGRSFRSRKYKTMINYDAEAYTVFGRVQLSPYLAEGSGELFESSDGGTTSGASSEPSGSPLSSPETTLPIGVQRDRQGQALIKKGGQPCASAAELAEALPVRVMNGHSFSLLEGAPVVRRQFLDWLVFHVEHDFYSVWRSYEKCLKHRNSLLRRGKIDPLQLAPWDRELAALAARLDRFRDSAFHRLQLVFSRLISGFEGLEKLSLRYYRGWDAEQEFSELLQSTQERDSELGYTRQGPHRADVKIMSGKVAAVDVLSRGQQKIVVSALLIAQGMVYSEQRKRRCVYLIDDLPAELDEHFRLILAEWLVDMGCQVFVTGVEKAPVLAAWQGVWQKQTLREQPDSDNSDIVAEGSSNVSDSGTSDTDSAAEAVAGIAPDNGKPGHKSTTTNDIRVFHVKHGVVEQEKAPEIVG